MEAEENKKKAEIKRKEFDKEDKDLNLSGEETSSSSKEVIQVMQNITQQKL